jgi:hypothetical protein
MGLTYTWKRRSLSFTCPHSQFYKTRPTRFRARGITCLKVCPSHRHESLNMTLVSWISVFFLVYGVYAQGSSNCQNSATSRNCWGQYDINTNYYNTIPNTGVTVSVNRPISGYMTLVYSDSHKSDIGS